MENLIENLNDAKDNVETQNALLKEYLPFVKKQIGNSTGLNTSIAKLDYDDRLSISMLVFVNCIKQYDERKGSFVNYVSVSIKNRLLDEAKSLSNKGNVVTIEEKQVEQLSQSAYDKDQERKELASEITQLNSILKKYAITFQELSTICPKQKRSRKQCYLIAKSLIDDRSMKEKLIKNLQISQQELSLKLGISIKTIEKYRKYIVTVALILMGDYPNIKAFLPGYEEI